MKKRRWLLPALMPLLIVSCASLGVGLTPPDVSLSDIRFEDMTLFESTFTVYLRVVNKNQAALSLSGGAMDLALDGTKIMTAVSDQAASVPGLSSTIVPVQAHVSNMKIIPLLANLISKSQSDKGLAKVDYDLDGHFFLQDSIGPRLSFEKTGALGLDVLQRLESSLMAQGLNQLPGLIQQQ